MKKCTVLVSTLLLLAAAIMLASSNALEAADESPYLLSDHGTVRVLRGLEPEKIFETAKLPVEIDVAPAAAPEPQVEPKLTISQADGDAFGKAQGRWFNPNRPSDFQDPFCCPPIRFGWTPYDFAFRKSFTNVLDSFGSDLCILHIDDI